MKDCTIEGCKNEYYAKGFCNAHYIRNRKGMDMSTLVRVTGRENCKIENCPNEHYIHV